MSPTTNRLATDLATVSLQAHALEALEGRFALRVAGQLSRGAEALPHDILERLRIAREQSVDRARLARRAAVASTQTAQSVLTQGKGTAALSGPPSLWLRLASALPLVVLVAGLVMIQQHHTLEQINVAAEIDAALLADELPPAAYGDAGFSEYLRGAAAP